MVQLEVVLHIGLMKPAIGAVSVKSKLISECSPVSV